MEVTSIVTIAGSVIAGFATVSFFILRLGFSMGRLSKGLEWNNQAMEKLIQQSGSLPPRAPRPKLVTLDLDDPWSAIEKEAREKHRR